MRHDHVYSPKNVISLVAVFVAIFWLLYALGSFLHESRKISTEIDAIRTKNEKALTEIEQKKQHLTYLKTPQRVDKEAKIPMNKRLPGEKVLVFIEEKLNILPTKLPQKVSRKIIEQKIPPLEKWRWLFFGKQ